MPIREAQGRVVLHKEVWRPFSLQFAIVGRCHIVDAIVEASQEKDGLLKECGYRGLEMLLYYGVEQICGSVP